jgi:hypothetical protein
VCCRTDGSAAKDQAAEPIVEVRRRAAIQINADQKSQLISNLVGPLKTMPRFIQVRQLMQFYKADATMEAVLR